MDKSDGAAYIKKAKQELSRSRKRADFFASEYRKCRERKSDMTKKYKLLVKIAEETVNRQERHIQEQIAYQQKHDHLTLRIAELESKLNIEAS
jgi:hypothetical protein